MMSPTTVLLAMAVAYSVGLIRVARRYQGSQRWTAMTLHTLAMLAITVLLILWRAA